MTNAVGPTGLSVSGIMHATSGRCCFEECPCVPPPPDLTGWWTLDESLGATAFNEVLFANDGSHLGSPLVTVGQVNAARRYGGTGAYTEVSNHADFNPGSGEFSIDCWIRTSAGSGRHVIVSKQFVNFTSGFDMRGYELAVDGGALRLDLATGATVFDQEAFTFVGPTVADGRWHLVAATVRRGDPFGVKLYVDGAPQTFATSISGSLSSAAPLRIGSRTGTPQFPPGEFFDGAIDEVEFFKRALTPAEIWAIWRAGSNGKCRRVFDIGDVNCDGFITVGDISGFVLALTDPTQYDVQYPDCDIDLADVNGDGFVTVGDISAFVALLTGG